jgi:hypothetical protein
MGTSRRAGQAETKRIFRARLVLLAPLVALANTALDPRVQADPTVQVYLAGQAEARPTFKVATAALVIPVVLSTRVELDLAIQVKPAGRVGVRPRCKAALAFPTDPAILGGAKGKASPPSATNTRIYPSASKSISSRYLCISFRNLAVGAVLGEPVSAGRFPDNRENTGNFC